MPGRAAGLRAKDSVAAATALPCARPHTAEAIAMENPAVMAIQLVSLAPPCAKAGMAKHRADRVMNRYFKVRMVVFLLVSIFRQWVVDAIPCRRPHACGYKIKISALRQ